MSLTVSSRVLLELADSAAAEMGYGLLLGAGTQVVATLELLVVDGVVDAQHAADRVEQLQVVEKGAEVIGAFYVASALKPLTVLLQLPYNVSTTLVVHPEAPGTGLTEFVEGYVNGERAEVVVSLSAPEQASVATALTWDVRERADQPGARSKAHAQKDETAAGALQSVEQKVAVVVRFLQQVSQRGPNEWTQEEQAMVSDASELLASLPAVVSSVEQVSGRELAFSDTATLVSLVATAAETIDRIDAKVGSCIKPVRRVPVFDRMAEYGERERVRPGSDFRGMAMRKQRRGRPGW